MTSQILSAVLLVSITITASAIVGVTIIDQSQTTSTSLRLQITSVQLRDMNDPGKAFFSFDARNTGTISIVSASVWFQDETGEPVVICKYPTNSIPCQSGENLTKPTNTEECNNNKDAPFVLDPGQVWSVKEIVDLPLIDSNKHILNIQATASDCSKFSDQMWVVV